MCSLGSWQQGPNWWEKSVFDNQSKNLVDVNYVYVLVIFHLYIVTSWSVLAFKFHSVGFFTMGGESSSVKSLFALILRIVPCRTISILPSFFSTKLYFTSFRYMFSPCIVLPIFLSASHCLYTCFTMFGQICHTYEYRARWPYDTVYRHFFYISSQMTHHSSPFRASFGVSFGGVRRM